MTKGNRARRRSRQTSLNRINKCQLWNSIPAPHLCSWCHKPLRHKRLATVDHVVAIADGGTNDPGNLVLSCKDCNSARSSRQDLQKQLTLALWKLGHESFAWDRSRISARIAEIRKQLALHPY